MYGDLPNYDAWLEAPYQRRAAQEPPDEIQELLGVRIWLEEEDAWGTVGSYEVWEDADEDGRYGGVDLVVRVGSRSLVMSPAEVTERWLVTLDDRRVR
jgi:hypothetical protein